MSTKEIAIDLINKLPNYQVEKIIYILRGMQLADDPFFTDKNLSLLENSANEMAAGKVITKDLEYIRELANG